MFAIENCYRIIFEAMLEDSIFMCIAKRIEEYTGAGVAFVAGTGKELACSCIWAKLFPVYAGEGHLTFEDYGLIRDRQELDGRSWCVTPVYGGKIAIGYVVLMYGEKEEEGRGETKGGKEGERDMEGGREGARDNRHVRLSFFLTLYYFP